MFSNEIIFSFYNFRISNFNFDTNMKQQLNLLTDFFKIICKNKNIT